MDACMITFRSITPAQRGENALRQAGIAATVQRTPRLLAEQGCGYSLQLACGRLPQAVDILRHRGIAFRKAYKLRGNAPEEIQL